MALYDSLYDYRPILGQESPPLSNQGVTLLLVAKTEKGWRERPVAFDRNGKIRPTLPRLVTSRSTSPDLITFSGTLKALRLSALPGLQSTSDLRFGLACQLSDPLS